MKRLALLAALCAAPVAAQEVPALADKLNDLNGSEVTASGLISFAPRDRSVLNIGSATIPVRFALSREDEVQLEGCRVELSRGNCLADVLAEVQIDGTLIRLTIYEIVSLTRD